MRRTFLGHERCGWCEHEIDRTLITKMANILIVYATTEGHTRKIAQTIGGQIRAAGHDTEIVDSADIRPDLTLRVFDGFVLLGSLHQGFHQRSLVHFVKAHAEDLSKAPSAFLSVSLTAAHKEGDHQDELDKCAEVFFEQTGWRPTVWAPVAGALKYLEYDWLKRMVLRAISKSAGGDIDTSQDYEYTNWAELEQFIGRFLAESFYATKPKVC